MDAEQLFERIIHDYQIPCASSPPDPASLRGAGRFVPRIALQPVQCERHRYLVVYPAAQCFSLEKFSLNNCS